MNNLTNFGQHFLVDYAVINSFIKACNLKPQEKVLEIGPGQGVLTELLAQTATKVTALEVDTSLRPELNKLMARHSNLEIIFQNALKFRNFNDYHLLCGALSFAIFEPLMIRLIRYSGYKRLVFLVSYKVKKDFLNKQGLLYYLLNAFFSVSFGPKILPKAFSPKPRTSGVIIKLKPQKPSNQFFEVWRQRFLTDSSIWQLKADSFKAI
jgi:16S rRNA (adenine1518-N6/adenine1519-N6)-dimethyltransferase